MENMNNRLSLAALPDDILLTPKEVADVSGLSIHYLAVARCKGYPDIGLPYLKLSAKTIRYRVGDVRTFIAGRLQNNGEPLNTAE